MGKNFKTSHNIAKLDDEAKGWMRDSGETCKNENHQLYFVYRASGFISKNWSNSILSEYFEELRSFYGLIELNKIIAKGFGFSDKQPAVFANRVYQGGKSELILVTGPESDIKDCFNAGTRPNTDDRLENGESIEEIFEDTRKLLVSEGARRFKAAAAWMLRAELSSRNLDRAIYASICLEVLLGDRETSDRIGLSKLMANRCAYSLGQNDADRKSIIQSFLEFYKLRSEIVHSGRTSMNAKERGLVNTGLKLAKRMLSDEVRRVLVVDED